MKLSYKVAMQRVQFKVQDVFTQRLANYQMLYKWFLPHTIALVQAKNQSTAINRTHPEMCDCVHFHRFHNQRIITF